jgi:anti-sigma B factor antagonist
MSSTGVWCTVTWTDLGGGTASVVVGGEVDAATAPRLEEAMAEAARTATDALLVDTGAVTFMDAAGLRVLLSTLDEMTRRHVRMRLDPISRPVVRLLDAAGVAHRFCAVGDAAERA